MPRTMPRNQPGNYSVHSDKPVSIYADIEQKIVTGHGNPARLPDPHANRTDGQTGPIRQRKRLVIMAGIMIPAILSIGASVHLFGNHRVPDPFPDDYGVVLPATPNTGVITWHSPALKALPTGEIRISTKPRSLPAFVRIESWHTSELIADAFVRPGETAILLMPVGSYRLNLAHGRAWRGDPISLFGRHTLSSVYPGHVNVRGSQEGGAPTEIDVSRLLPKQP